MRISDWSSDVCSSDLESVRPRPVRLPQLGRARCEGSRTLFLPAQAAVDGGGGAVAGRAGPRRGAARPAARTDEGDGAGRDAAGGVRDGRDPARAARAQRSEEHTSELQSQMRTSYAV